MGERAEFGSGMSNTNMAVFNKSNSSTTESLDKWKGTTKMEIRCELEKMRRGTKGNEERTDKSLLGGKNNQKYTYVHLLRFEPNDS